MDIGDDERAFMANQIETYLDVERSMQLARMRVLLTMCESPIEQRLGCALAFAEWPLYFVPPLRAITPNRAIAGDAWQTWRPDMSEYVLILPQQQIGDYRADFVIAARVNFRPDAVLLVIECDGHDWHERTKEQAQRDKARDRYLTAQGFRVFRFTGSEIWRDANRCAAEIAAYLSDIDAKARD